jgi:hypothetical protein
MLWNEERERERERERAPKKEKGWKFERGRVKLRIGSVQVYVIPNKGQLEGALSLSANHWMIVSSTSSPWIHTTSTMRSLLFQHGLAKKLINFQI